ncbi:MAG: ATP-binding cassette domain-containing protein [Bryobacteraceae bacterium]
MAESIAQPVLQFDRVSVSFDDTPALEDVSFEVFPGDTRVILGAAGSGKTVLLKAALGLVKPDSGRVFAFGEEATGLKESQLADLRARVGMLFQEGALFDSLTIEENVAYPLLNQRSVKFPQSEVQSRVEETLRFVELEHTLDKFPSELSGGMRRRVGIARAIVTEPPLLLYDSPTAGLDPITAYTIIALIIKERDLRNTTTMIVTHRYQDGSWLADFRYNPNSGQLEPAVHNGQGAQTRTTFMVLRKGRMVFEGSRDELEASQDSYISSFVRQQ